MYRRKDRIRKKPSDTNFWQQSATLKKWGFKNSVHALAYFNRKAYDFIIQELHNETSLELIMSGLWKYHKQTLLYMKTQGLGTLSPNSLHTYKKNFYDKGVNLDIDSDIANRKGKIQTLVKRSNQLNAILNQIKLVQDKLDMPTNIGIKMAQEEFYTSLEISKLQRKLRLADY